jgi:DNA-directed RNA polymerase subunit omega
MLRGQHLRVAAIQEVDDITTVVSGQDPISVAMDEIEDGTLGYDADAFDAEIKGMDEAAE